MLLLLWLFLWLYSCFNAVRTVVIAAVNGRCNVAFALAVGVADNVLAVVSQSK